MKRKIKKKKNIYDFISTFLLMREIFKIYDYDDDDDDDSLSILTWKTVLRFNDVTQKKKRKHNRIIR